MPAPTPSSAPAPASAPTPGGGPSDLRHGLPIFGRRLRHPMFWLFIACYSVVHLKFEYDYWTTDHLWFFAKYEVATTAEEAFAVAKKAYFTKATWMIALVWMQAAGLRFREALAWSFLLYGVELMLLFPPRLYTGLNLLLAAGFVIEVMLERRWGVLD